MGNILTCYVEKIFPIREQEIIQKCHKCRGQDATYRCQVDTRDQRFELFTLFYSPHQNARVDSTLSPHMKETYYALAPYVKSESMFEVQYIGCNQCMTDAASKYFTHLPNGWTMFPDSTFSYESIHLEDPSL